MHTATHRRLSDELNVSATLEFIYKFLYQARYGDAGSEHELCWVYLGRCTGEVRINRTEIADYRWIAPGQLTCELATRRDEYTPWLHMEWERLSNEWSETLARYTRII